jgi:hypothetical protein
MSWPAPLALKPTAKRRGGVSMEYEIVNYNKTYPDSQRREKRNEIFETAVNDYTNNSHNSRQNKNWMTVLKPGQNKNSKR